ncbi:hypothetical protein [Solwaraspora sp. WMMD937]|uniref:hypothetical protein n=1 Tax=Solwaraspora sp. WMMD937 TaxID=3016090 RepID=UPI0032B38108
MIADRRAQREALDLGPSTDDVIRDRAELAEQIRALGELVEMAAAYGYDVSRPAANGDRVPRRDRHRRTDPGHPDHVPLPADALQPGTGAGAEP